MLTVALLVFTGILLVLAWWFSRTGVSVKWYEWLIGALGLYSVIFGIWHYFGSLGEGYSSAGLMGLLIFGGIGLVLLAIASQFVWRRQQAS
jgi:hypothetical protein